MRSTRRCSWTSARLSSSEQKHFEQAMGQLERFVDDKVLVCRQERASVAEKLRAFRDRRDEVVGATAREPGRGGASASGQPRRSARTADCGSGFPRRRGLSEMAKRVSRPSVSRANGEPAVPGRVPDHAADSGAIVLRLLHTADWHLGRRFPSFSEEAQKKLSRARMEVIAKDPRRRPAQQRERDPLRRRSVRRSDAHS